MKALVIVFIAAIIGSAAFAGRAVHPIRPDEEPWPAHCAESVAKASRVDRGVVRPEVISRNEQLPDLKKWHLRCGDVAVQAFELLIDETGSVKCARTLRLGGRRHPTQLYEEIRKNLRAWTFTPARRGGTAIPVVFPVTIAYKCN